jgi:hydrogenase maturation protease
MARVLVIGYGNPLRGDDGVGWRAAEELARRLPEEEVQILTRHQLTLEMAEALSLVERVIFIDACEGPPAGHVEWLPITPDAGLPGLYSHHVTPQALLACARELYGSCPAAGIFSVAGESFGYTEELSPRVRAVLPTLLEQVRAAATGE